MQARLTVWRKDGTAQSAVLDFDDAIRDLTIAEMEPSFKRGLIEPASIMEEPKWIEWEAPCQ